MFFTKKIMGQKPHPRVIFSDEPVWNFAALSLIQYSLLYQISGLLRYTFTSGFHLAAFVAQPPKIRLVILYNIRIVL